MTHPLRPKLVMIEAKEHRYSRYDGTKVPTNIVVTEELLLAEEIEMFRKDPRSILPDPDPIPA